MALPDTMKAVHQLDPHSPSLTLSPSVPLPIPSGRNDHLLRVRAVSPCLNELTWAAFDPDPDPNKEHVPGTEASAVVVQAPHGSEFPPGSEVFYRMHTQPTGLPIPGCLREYTVANEAELAPRPTSLGPVEAAAVPLSALTAWQGLFEHGTLDRRALTHNDGSARRANAKVSVLVTGATGGVGLWVVTLAKAAGAGRIVALANPSKTELVKSRGADEVIPYTTQTVRSWAETQQQSAGVDLVIDTVGGRVLEDSWAAVRAGGTILTVSSSDMAMEKPESVQKEVAKAQWYLVDSRGEDLREIGKLIDGGKVASPVVDSVYEFEDFQAAFDRVQSRGTNGKVVIKVAA